MKTILIILLFLCTPCLAGDHDLLPPGSPQNPYVATPNPTHQQGYIVAPQYPVIDREGSLMKPGGPNNPIIIEPQPGDSFTIHSQYPE